MRFLRAMREWVTVWKVLRKEQVGWHYFDPPIPYSEFRQWMMTRGDLLEWGDMLIFTTIESQLAPAENGDKVLKVDTEAFETKLVGTGSEFANFNDTGYVRGYSQSLRKFFNMNSVKGQKEAPRSVPGEPTKALEEEDFDDSERPDFNF